MMILKWIFEFFELFLVLICICFVFFFIFLGMCVLSAVCFSYFLSLPSCFFYYFHTVSGWFLCPPSSLTPGLWMGEFLLDSLCAWAQAGLGAGRGLGEAASRLTSLPHADLEDASSDFASCALRAGGAWAESPALLLKLRIWFQARADCFCSSAESSLLCLGSRLTGVPFWCLSSCVLVEFLLHLAACWRSFQFQGILGVMFLKEFPFL